MTALTRAGSILSLAAWLLPGSLAHGVVLHVAVEHPVHVHHGHDAPHEHHAHPHSHHADGDEHHAEHHAQVAGLLAPTSTVVSRVDCAPAALLPGEPLRDAAPFALPKRLPEPVPRARGVPLNLLNSILRI